MPSISIPDEALPDLKRIAEVDGAIFDSLLSAIRETKPTLRRGQLRKEILEKVKSSDEAEIRSIFRTALILYSIKERANVSAQELASDLSSSAATSRPSDFPPDKKEQLTKRLKLLLDFDVPLGVTSKALEVMTGHE